MQKTKMPNFSLQRTYISLFPLQFKDVPKHKFTTFVGLPKKMQKCSVCLWIKLGPPTYLVFENNSKCTTWPLKKCMILVVLIWVGDFVLCFFSFVHSQDWFTLLFKSKITKKILLRNSCHQFRLFKKILKVWFFFFLLLTIL